MKVVAAAGVAASAGEGAVDIGDGAGAEAAVDMLAANRTAMHTPALRLR